MAKKIIVIDGYIGNYAYSKQFVRNELKGQGKNDVLVQISSLGGAVDHALNIYDQFIEHGNVTAELSAFVASSATLIALGAKHVRMNENSFYLIHKAMNWVDEWGYKNEDEIEELIEKLEKEKIDLAKITLQLAKMYVKKTGKELQEVVDLMKEETWLTAEEALDWGFVDEVFVPEQAVNYLENSQMVAMIAASGFPDLPRKNEQKQTNLPTTAQVDEEGLFNRLWNRITNKQQENSPKNKKEMKKQFLNVNKVLTVDKLESEDEGVFLNEEQLESIDGQLAQVDTLTNERNTAHEERDTANSERETAIAAFDAIDPTVAAAEGYEAKEAAIRTLLAAQPGDTPPGAQGGDNKETAGEDWDTIDSLPHNKAVDKNS
ncbi:Clp protease ClpP [Sunxiuqinia sp. sy24]|uniref:Clp protease ClpP n=1 Tax=Sunxiuqinia sp. sy24 TaxID=3461495 RepID=UPI00404523B5